MIKAEVARRRNPKLASARDDAIKALGDAEARKIAREWIKTAERGGDPKLRVVGE